MQRDRAHAQYHWIVSVPVLNNPYRKVACVLHIYLLPCCTYCAYTLHACCTHNISILHVCWYTKIGSTPHACHIHAHEVAHMYARCVQLLCAAYMQLFVFSIHAACTQTAYISSYACMACVWRWTNFCVCACMQYGCIVCAARVQHTCLTCADMQYVCCIHA